jgi:MFS family permease
MNLEDDTHCTKDDVLNLYNANNIGLAMTYFVVGINAALLLTPLNVYLVKNLNAEPSVQVTMSILQIIPWSFKLVFGFISDAFPLFGQKRKPYLVIGIIICSSFSMLYTMVMEDSVIMLAITVFMSTLGLIQMDVMADTMVVLRSKCEKPIDKGKLQSTCYAIRYWGRFIGAILGALLFNKAEWGWGLSFFQITLLLGIIPPVLILPFIYK